MIRLFVALELPDGVRQRLAGLAGGVPGARWTDPGNLHLTLRFIGEVPDDRAAEIDAALGEVAAPAFDLVLEGTGQFGTGRSVRALWAGVERNEALLHLRDKLESALVRIGLPREERKFTPHVTLARLRDTPPHRIGRFLQDHALFRAGPFPIRHFTLFRSHLGRTGPVYEPLREYPLGLLAPEGEEERLEPAEYPLLHEQDLMLAILRSAEEAPASVEDALARLRGSLAAAGTAPPVDPDELWRRLSRARLHLLKAGLLSPIDSLHATLTDRGRAVLEEHPTGVDDTVLAAFPEFRAFLAGANGGAHPETARLPAYDEGFAAFEEGLAPSDNPYPFDQDRHLAWENGWFGARDAAERRVRS